MNKKINIDNKKIKDEILNLKKNLINLNFQKSSGQLEKTSKIKDTKKHPDHAIMEELAEHIKTEKMEMQNQEAKKKVNSLVTYVNLRDSTGSTALHYACQQRFETAQDICEFLLDRGARIGVIAGRVGITPLHLAIKSKNIPLAMFLLERGAPIDTKTLSFDSEDDLKDIM